MAKSTLGRNILIIKPGAIGDLLQLTPVIRALAARYPGARISLLVGTPLTASLFRYNRFVAETIIFDRKGAHRTFFSLLGLWRQVRRSKFDLVVNFQRSNLKTWFFATAALPCRILVYHKSSDKAVHVVDNYLSTLAPLGIAEQDRRLELAVGREDEQFADDLFTANRLDGETVIALNPGASHAVNRWSADRFAALADVLADRVAAKAIIVGGSEDIALADSISSHARSNPLVLSGKVTLLQLGAVFRRCAVLVSGDTGPLHLATAVGTRVVALFGAADPARTGPVGEGHRVVRANGISCIPCRSRTCSNTRMLACMEGISTQDVADTVVDMLKTKPDSSL